MPYVNPKSQPKHDHDHNTFGHRTTVVVVPTTRRPFFISPNVETIDHSINRGILLSPNYRNDVDGSADSIATFTASAGTGSDAAPAAAAADVPTAIKPTHAYSNRNVQANINSIFIPASTSKYPIKQNTIIEDFRERFCNFVEHWKKAFVYTSRK